MTSELTSFIERKVVVLSETNSLKTAARAMCEQRVGCVLVSDGHGRPTGILTDRDIVWELATGSEEILSTPISAAMTAGVICVDENASVEVALQTMAQHGIRRIPIISCNAKGDDKFVGVVTLDDLLAAKCVSPDLTSVIVKQQVQQKIRSLAARTRAVLQNEEQQEHTLARFYKLVEERCYLTKANANDLSEFILSSLVRRLPAHGAARFIVQLPKLMQDELFALPAGPDRSITAPAMLSSVCERFRMDENRARFVVEGFWNALLTFLNASDLDFVLAQIPSGLRNLLQGVGKPTVSNKPAPTHHATHF